MIHNINFAKKLDELVTKLEEEHIRLINDFHSYELFTKHKLSHSAIKELFTKYSNKLSFHYLFEYQILSHSTIKFILDKYPHEVDYYRLIKHQKLSKSIIDFIIEKSNNRTYGLYMFKYQKLSKAQLELIKSKYCLKFPIYCHLYKTESEKLKFIYDNNLNTVYDLGEDENGKYLLAYKSTKKGGFSTYDARIKYEVGKTYEAHCDYNIDDLNSFGLSAWSSYEALKHCNEELYKVKIYIKDIGVILLNNNNKIRCRKQTFIKKISGSLLA